MMYLQRWLHHFSWVFSLLVLSGAAGVGAEEFRLLEPGPSIYVTGEPPRAATQAVQEREWIPAAPKANRDETIYFGRRLYIRLKDPEAVAAIVEEHPLRLVRKLAEDVFLLEAPDALSSLRAAQALGSRSGVVACSPVRRTRASLHGAYAPLPNDPYFSSQHYSEFRDENGLRQGADLNVREAWPLANGAGVTVAVVDVGVETAHPDLAMRTAGAPHFNFVSATSSGEPAGRSAPWAHGTSVAGLIAAEAYNQTGVVGVAPGAALAAWVIFDSDRLLVSDEVLMEMYSAGNDTVEIQNHSWGNHTKQLSGPTLIEQLGIDDAYTNGRGGLGVVLVRSAGNGRLEGQNVNDDGYPSDPRAIAVAAVTPDGRAVPTSEPGACLLLGASARDLAGNGLFTTDLTGTNGAHAVSYFPPDEALSDYRFDSLGFSGTSAAAAQVSGVAALVLSARPDLHVRDVQLILALSARHFDWEDPDLARNGAGLWHSHNVGFGIPDAAEAVRLARGWISRPAREVVTRLHSDVIAIPDDGFRIEVSGMDVPAQLQEIRALPGTGIHADEPTDMLPLVSLDEALDPIVQDLSGTGVLIRRNTIDNWATPIRNAANAGAEFAIVYNNATGSAKCPGGDQLCLMMETDYVPIPAVFVGQSDGEALVALAGSEPSVRALLGLDTEGHTFSVSEALICEHVGLRVKTDHPLRGDLRITLVSPSGTRSVLQKLNDDTSPGPSDWTYWSTRHFLESSVGDWRVEVGDEFVGNSGSVLEVSLLLHGVPILDSDADGLDDSWEMNHFEGLSAGASGDFDGDGYSNAREQAMGTDPAADHRPLMLNLSVWNEDLVRVSWPGVEGRNYSLRNGDALENLTEISAPQGAFPVTELFLPKTATPTSFFLLEQTSP